MNDFAPFSDATPTIGAGSADAPADATSAPAAKPAVNDFAPFSDATPSSDVEHIFDHGLIAQESGGQQFDDKGRPLTSRKGAIGVAQVMPQTAPEAAQLAGLPFDEIKYRTDPAYNKALGRAYFAKQVSDFGDTAKGLAAYNAGPGATRSAIDRAAQAGDPNRWMEYLPAETRSYVPSILARAGRVQRQDAPSSGSNYFDVPDVKPRAFMEGVKDTGLGVLSGLFGLVKSGGEIGGLATGNMDNVVTRVADATQQFLQGEQSEQLQQKRAARDAAVKNDHDGVLSQFWTAFSQTVSDPALLTDVVASNAATLLPGAGVGRMVAARAGANAMLKAMEAGPVSLAARQAIAKSAAEAGVLSAKGAMAVQQGADVAQQAYDDALEKTPAQWAANPVYAQRVAAGEDPSKVKHELALQSARATIGPAAAISLGANSLPGGDSVERVLVGGAARKAGQTGNVLARTAKTTAGETLTETLEEGGGQYAANVANQQFVDPNQDLSHNVGSQAGVGAAGGFGQGAVAGPFHQGRAPQSTVPPGLELVADKAADPNSPLSRAAMAGNTGPAADAARAAQAQQQADQEAAANAPDPIAGKVSQMAEALRQPGALEALRAKDSPVNVQKVLSDLAIAQSPSTPAAAREQAIARLEYAMEWAGIAQPGAASPANKQNVAQPTGTAYDSDAAAQQRAQDEQAQQQANDDAANKSAPLPPVDSLIAALKVAPALRSAEQTALVRQAQARLTPEQQEVLDKAATFPAGMSATEKIQLENLRGTANPAAAVGQHTAATVASQNAADSSGNAGSASNSDLNVGTSVPNTGTDARETIAAPQVSTPAGSGRAVLRKRRATLRQLIDMGLNQIEKTDAGFVLTDGKRQFALENGAEAQLARNELAASIRAAANGADTAPTQGQKEAGNYKKGHLKFGGLDITVENPAGSKRSGVAPDGTPWSVEMSAHYGYVKRTEGADGDHVDVYLVDHPRQNAPVYVFDQYNNDGSFDEHKAVLGALSERQAQRTYDAHFSDGSGPRRRRGMKVMTLAEFKAWAESNLAKKPAAGAADGAAKSDRDTSSSARAAGANNLATGGVADRSAGDARADAGSGDHAAGVPAAGGGSDQSAGDADARSHVTVQVDGKSRKIELVDLPDAGTSAERSGRPRKVGSAAVELIRQIAAVLGKKVVVFRDDTIGDGFVDPRFPDTIFLNEKTTISPVAVFGHEVMHQIKEQMPEVHAAITKVVAERIKAGGNAQFRRDYHGKPTEGTAWSDAPLKEGEIEELVSDIGGNFMADPTFWPAVFEQVGKDHPEQAKSLVAQLAAFVQQLVAKLVGGLKGQPLFKATKFVDDLETIRAAFKDGLAKYIAEHGITKVAMQAEVLKATTAQAKQSKARTQSEYITGEDGQPVTVYHGTNANFEKFEAPEHDISWGPAGDLKFKTFYFTSDRSIASEYGSNVKAVQLRAKSPKRLNARGATWDDYHPFSKIVDAMVAGHDAVIIKNIRDGADGSGDESTVYVVFKPEQIEASSAPRATDSSDNSTDERGSGAEPAKAGAGNGTAPVYGKAQPGSVSAVGVHFSTQPRSRLDSAHYGTGAKGLERVRLEGSENADIRPRTFFYVDKGNGIQPEAGVGGVAHRVELRNLYDVQKDPQGIVKANPGPNNWERAIVRAGFDGYLNNDPKMPQAFAVLVGKHPNVPVQQFTPPGFSAPVVAPTSTSRALISKELDAIDMSNIPGAKLRSGTLTVPMEQRDAANAEMERIGSTVRFSTARGADAPTSEYDEVEKKYRDTPEWMKAPNGAKTQLTERQWIHVRTPAFKAWFGDWEAAAEKGGVWAVPEGEVSKVVDGNGEPRVVYHGSDKGGFMDFRESGGKKRGDLGIFATDNLDMASSYVRSGTAKDVTNPESGEQTGWKYIDNRTGEVAFTMRLGDSPEDIATREQANDAKAVPLYGEMPRAGDQPGVYALFMNIRNPNEDYFEGANWEGSRFDQYMVFDKETGEPIQNEEGREVFNSVEEARKLAAANDANVEEAPPHYRATDDVVTEARKAKQDGAIIYDVIDDGGGAGYHADPGNVYVTFDPNNVKSADFNNGEYSVDSNDIRLSTRRDGLNQDIVDAAGKVLRYLTPAERMKLRRDTAKKLIDIFDKLPSANEMAAVAHAGKAKRGWYHNSAQALEHVFGPDAPRFAALLAAMSPQTSVEDNLENALRTWKNWTAAERPTDKTQIHDIMGRSVQGKKGNDSVLWAWVPNSVRALTAKDPQSLVLSGPKVNSFMLNLRGVVHEVTNDAWMANYAAVDQQIFGGSLNVAGTDPGKGPGYMAMNAKVRQAAMTLTRLTGEEWTPAEVQETVWSWAKTLYELQNKDLGARELLDNKAVTDELIGATPDFRTQLHEEKNEDTLQRAGYGEQLSTLRSRADLAGPRAEGSEAGGQAGPFDPDTQARLERKAASRLEQLRDTRAAAEAVTRASGAHDARSSEGHPAAEEIKRSAPRPGRDEHGNLGGLPTEIEVSGLGTIEAGHWAAAEAVARSYTTDTGLAYNPPSEYVKVDKARAERIAKAYEEMAHEPQNPEVKQAYEALVKETVAQFRATQKAGLKVEFIDFDKQGDPYAASPRLMTEDVRDNNHMWVFSTRDGFGSSELDVKDNPLLAETEFEISGRKALVNDLFRVVHDYFGHVKEGVGFRADGEENAWRAHSAMFTPLARRALTTETRGQNSWVNFGQHGAKNRAASASETVYADQKTGLLPSWVSEEGATDAVDHAAPGLSLLEDGYKKLAGITFIQEFKVEETGKTARLKRDAAKSLRALDERQQELENLRACIGRKA